MAEDGDFGDFSSAFPDSKSAGRKQDGSNALMSDVVFEPVGNALPAGNNGAQLPQFDVFALNGGFADFNSFPIDSCLPAATFADGALPEIPPLPEDLQFGLVEEGRVAPAVSTAEPTSSQSTVSQPVGSTVPSVGGNAAAQNDPMQENVEFGDFEGSFDFPSNCDGHPQNITPQVQSIHAGDGGLSSRPDAPTHISSVNVPHGSLEHSTIQQVPSATSLHAEAPGEGFAEFGHFKQDLSSQQHDHFPTPGSQPPRTQSAGEVTFQSFAGDRHEDFGGFSNAGDEFGGFETAVAAPATTTQQPLDAVTTEKDDFGAFATSTPAVVPESNAGTHVLPPGRVFVVCFTSSAERNAGMDSSTVTLDTKDDSVLDFRWWSIVKRSVDFTVPLFKWDASHLQGCFYTSIKVDPMLVTKVDTTSVLSVGPALGQSAVVDLMESFGFEGGFEASPPTDCDTSLFATTADRFHRNIDDGGPTLLDLSLPNSPSEESQKDSFTLDADLQGLDLHSTQEERQLTSIEQLLLNERLVINRTTWMDSELEALGGAHLPPTSPPRSPHTQGHRVITKMTSFEQQLERLGLDTSKTTLAPTLPAVAEMSISARLVFDRLPDLSFMLQDSLVEDCQSYWK